MQQMVPQTPRNQTEGLTQTKYVPEEDTNKVWNRRLSSFWAKVLCLIGEDRKDSTEMASHATLDTIIYKTNEILKFEIEWVPKK